MRNKAKFVLFLLGAIVLALLIASIKFIGNDNEQKRITIGVIVPGNITEPGWNGIHYEGIKEASEELGIDIALKENIAEYSGQCLKAVNELISMGIKVIILVSYNYPDEIKETILNHPEVQFYCCAAFQQYPNYKNYFARVYQARYLSGIVAGLTTKNNSIGYIAAMNNAEVNRGMNAFTLGVKSVNSKATVHVKWTDSWDDAEKEKENLQKLYDQKNIDVVAYHQNQIHVIEKAEELGIFSIGYNAEKKNFSEKMLTSVSTNWTMVYKEILQNYLQQKNTEQINYWIGIELDAVQLSFYSDAVSDSVKIAVNSAIDRLKTGTDVFYGEIFDNTGIKRSDKNEVIGDSFLYDNMDWFVNGIEFLE